MITVNEKHYPQRKSPRLSGYNYAQSGAYFITICAVGRAHLFGKIVDDEMVWNGYGKIAQEEWERTPQIRREIDIDLFVVMPNHFHAIVLIVGDDSDADERPTDAQPCVPARAPRSLGSLIAGYKSVVTKRINMLRNTPGEPVWQGRYHDHIIRNEKSLNKIREYVLYNPVRWREDTFFVDG